MLCRWISFICSHLNSLCLSIGHFVLPNFSYLFIFWTCLLGLVGRWLRLVVLWSALGDAVEQENTNEETSYKHHYHSNWNCNPRSGTSCEGLYSIYVKGRGLELKYCTIPTSGANLKPCLKVLVTCTIFWSFSNYMLFLLAKNMMSYILGKAQKGLKTYLEETI